MGDPLNGGTGYSWFLVELTSEHVEPPVPPPPPDTVIGGGHPMVSFGGPPDFRDLRVSIPSQVDLPKEERFEFSLRSQVDLPITTISMALMCDVRVSTETQLNFSASRGPAEHWNAVLRDEEELLLSLYA
jgi:hypothetical protein